LGEVLSLINLPLLLSSLIGFLVLFFVLKKFLWKPVLDVIDERRASIEQAFQEVDDARADVAKMKADYEAQLGRINAEAQARLQEAVERGQQVAAEIRAAAEDSREKLLQRTQDDIAREKDKALAEIRNTAIDLSFTIARRVMREGLERDEHDRLVAGFIDELKGLN
jgi:F-type H+-transporting ATPase subunit b